MKGEPPKDLERKAETARRGIEFGERATAIFLGLTVLSLAATGYGVYQLFWKWEIWYGLKITGAGLLGGFVFGTIASYTEADAGGHEAQLRSIEIQQGKRKPGLWARLFQR